MRIAIVDDQATSRQQLVDYCQQVGQELGLHLILDTYPDGINLLDQFQSQYALIYLDVEMAYLDGMATARKLRTLDQDVLIVFVTNHAQVAIQGYEVEASDFLVKPLNYFTFQQHFKKMQRRLPQSDDFLLVKTGQQTERLNQADILYLESHGHYIDLVLTQRRLTIIDSLKNIETKLNPDYFCRCNHSYIVNLRHIDKVVKQTIHLPGQEIPISRTKKKAFQEQFTRYLGGQAK